MPARPTVSQIRPCMQVEAVVAQQLRSATCRRSNDPLPCRPQKCVVVKTAPACTCGSRTVWRYGTRSRFVLYVLYVLSALGRLLRTCSQLSSALSKTLFVIRLPLTHLLHSLNNLHMLRVKAALYGSIGHARARWWHFPHLINLLPNNNATFCSSRQQAWITSL
jgi:hypothetical protein